MREDLEILKGWPQHNGAPSWVLFDPLRNKYFRLGHDAFQLLSLWAKTTVEGVQEAAKKQLGRDIDEEEIGDVAKFLMANELSKTPPQDGYRFFAGQEAGGKKSIFGTALHSYLFFKIPLFRPDRFLQATWPLVAPFYTRMAVVIFAVLGVLALYLVSRQWEGFKGQFIVFLSLEGLLYYGVSLIFVKMCHELSHAYMAVRYGLKVPVIGIAFLVLMPILFTDTSNAWRLPSRRQRLMIDGAGIMAEIVLAVLATLLWIFLPDGPLRAVAFSVATVGWLLSLAVNLNPFMRFDGYYILSDWLGFENMQSRGFALARWRMREILFNLGAPKPERLAPRLQRAVILHAWGTWIYRFFLFIGIAVLVYSFFIKAVAIFLFVVEIAWFIFLPIFREIKEWWAMRQEIVSRKRTWVTIGFFTGLIVLAILPLSSRIEVPALLRSQSEVTIYPPVAGRLVSLNVRNGQKVSAGEALVVLASETLDRDIELTSRKIELLERRIARGNADAVDGAARRVLMSELATELDTRKGQMKRQEQLTIRAPFSGIVVDHDPRVHSGRMVARNQALFQIRQLGHVVLNGLVAEEQIDRLQLEASGVFFPDDATMGTLDVSLVALARTATSQLADRELAEIYGGKIPARPAQDKNLSPVGSFYAATMAVGINTQDYPQTVRGVVLLKGEARSFAGRVMRRVAGVLIRESGF